jgi:5'-nucleotidase
MASPLLLVTNDDGVHAPGIRALAEALARVGRVAVVAPDREASACSHSLSLRHPLRVEEIEPGVHAVDGTPADCVNLALVRLLPERPALVVSGINRGANLGDDIFYSGTVGAAREATFFGLPSIAVSLAERTPGDYAPAAGFAARLAALVLERGLPERTLLNVNVPPGTVGWAAITVQGRREHAGSVQQGLDSRSQAYYWIEEEREGWVRDEMSDIHAVRAGLVSVTPIQTDMTHQGAFERLREWQGLLAP